MGCSFFDNLADTFCRECPEREEKRDNKCVYLDTLYGHCEEYKAVTQNESELKRSFARLVRSHSKYS